MWFWLKHPQWRTQHTEVNPHSIESHRRLIVIVQGFLLSGSHFSPERDRFVWTIFICLWTGQVGPVKGLGAGGEQSEAKWTGQSEGEVSLIQLPAPPSYSAFSKTALFIHLLSFPPAPWFLSHFRKATNHLLCSLERIALFLRQRVRQRWLIKLLGR